MSHWLSIYVGFRILLQSTLRGRNTDQALSCLSLQRPGLITRPIYVGFMELTPVFLQVFRSFLVGIIPQILHTHSVLCYRGYIILASDKVVKQQV